MVGFFFLVVLFPYFVSCSQTSSVWKASVCDSARGHWKGPEQSLTLKHEIRSPFGTWHFLWGQVKPWALPIMHHYVILISLFFFFFFLHWSWKSVFLPVSHTSDLLPCSWITSDPLPWKLVGAICSMSRKLPRTGFKLLQTQVDSASPWRWIHIRAVEGKKKKKPLVTTKKGWWEKKQTNRKCDKLIKSDFASL